MLKTIPAASPKKLRSGDWGALAQTDSIKRGDLIRITTKSGKSWEAHVAKVIWTGDGKSIVATESGGGGPRKSGKVECKYCGCTDRSCVRGGACAGGPSFDPCFDCW